MIPILPVHIIIKDGLETINSIATGLMAIPSPGDFIESNHFGNRKLLKVLYSIHRIEWVDIITQKVTSIP